MRSRQRETSSAAGNGNHAPKRSGLVLDDYLHYVENMRHQFQLPRPTFGLAEVEAIARAKEAVELIVRHTIKRHGREIFSKPYSVLSEVGSSVLGEAIEIPSLYSGHRVHPNQAAPVLRKLLELGLQTLVQLPVRFPRTEPCPKRLKRLTSLLSRCALEVRVLYEEDQCGGRIRWHFRDNRTNERRLLALPTELEWTAEALQQAARLNAIKVNLGSPNPKVRFALWITRWLETSTGRKHYASFKEIVKAAFWAAGQAPPRWVERLETEKTLETRHRMKGLRYINAQPH